jgi:hypothetical protein
MLAATTEQYQSCAVRRICLFSSSWWGCSSCCWSDLTSCFSSTEVIPLTCIRRFGDAQCTCKRESCVYMKYSAPSVSKRLQREAFSDWTKANTQRQGFSTRFKAGTTRTVSLSLRVFPCGSPRVPDSVSSPGDASFGPGTLVGPELRQGDQSPWQTPPRKTTPRTALIANSEKQLPGVWAAESESLAAKSPPQKRRAGPQAVDWTRSAASTRRGKASKPAAKGGRLPCPSIWEHLLAIWKSHGAGFVRVPGRRVVRGSRTLAGQIPGGRGAKTRVTRRRHAPETTRRATDRLGPV